MPNGPAARDETPHRILILDDERQIRAMMDDLFTSLHYKVNAVRYIKEAMYLLEKFEISVAILDLGLSEIDQTGGLDLISFIKEKRPATKIIVFTGNENLDVKHLALRLGADRFLVKPGPIEKLIDTVRECCGG